MSIYLGTEKVTTIGGSISIGGTDTSDATAISSDILFDKTAYVNGRKIIGTMNNNGSISKKISIKDDYYVIPQGYHSGNGFVNIDEGEQLKIIPENIKRGVTILGVSGVIDEGSSGESNIVAQSKTITPQNFDQTIYPDSGYNCLSYVIVKKIPYIEEENLFGGTTVTIG